MIDPTASPDRTRDQLSTHETNPDEDRRRVEQVEFLRRLDAARSAQRAELRREQLRLPFIRACRFRDTQFLPEAQPVGMRPNFGIRPELHSRIAPPALASGAIGDPNTNLPQSPSIAPSMLQTSPTNAEAMRSADEPTSVDGDEPSTPSRTNDRDDMIEWSDTPIVAFHPTSETQFASAQPPAVAAPQPASIAADPAFRAMLEFAALERAGPGEFTFSIRLGSQARELAGAHIRLTSRGKGCIRIAIEHVSANAPTEHIFNELAAALRAEGLEVVE